jgi:uncharacterized phiE125 gp8 family phage protein
MKVIVQPTDEPLSIDECRSHLEAQYYGDSDIDPADDEMILAWLAAAREHCEQFLGLSLATKTLEIALDEFPEDAEPIELPFGPVRQVLSLTVGSGSDAEVIDAESYVLDDYRNPARLAPVSQWPTGTASTNNIKVQYLAGYGVDSDGGEALPKVIRAAILLMLGHLYANREATTEKAMATLPFGVEAILRPMRARLGMA